jgi:hypothetical protein
LACSAANQQAAMARPIKISLRILSSSDPVGD